MVRAWERNGDPEHRPRGTSPLDEPVIRLEHDELDLMAWLHTCAGMPWDLKPSKVLSARAVAVKEKDIRDGVARSHGRPSRDFLLQGQRSPDGQWLGSFWSWWGEEPYEWAEKEQAAAWLASSPDHDIRWWGGQKWICLRDRSDVPVPRGQRRLDDLMF
jgi:hypothetical protein